MLSFDTKTTQSYKIISERILKRTLCEVKNPRDPRLKETTGGTEVLNKFDACKMSPSPPKHVTKSTRS